MSVKLREKKIKNGKVSLYLDINHNKNRWPEFLSIYVNKKHPTEEDKEKKRLAEEIRVKREHELLVAENGLTDKRRKQASYVTYLEKYLSEKNESGLYSGTLQKVKDFVGKQSLSLSAVTKEWVKSFEKYMLGNVSNNTAFRYSGVVRDSLNEAVRREIIIKNPYHSIPRNQRLRLQKVFITSFTLADLQNLSNTVVKINKQIKQGYFFGCFTGLRWCDVNQLRWDEIVVREIEGKERYFIYFEQEKTEAIEYLPIAESAVDILKERQIEALSERESPYVFPELYEKPGSDKNYQTVRRGLKKWAKAAGLPAGKLKFHTSRHSFATNVLENGDGDLYVLSKLLGHKSIQSTETYAHVRDKRKMSAVDSLPKIEFNKQIA